MKKFFSKRRKKKALKLLLVKEMESNLLVFNRIYRVVSDIKFIFDEIGDVFSDSKIKFVLKSNGDYEYKSKYVPADDFYYTIIIPVVKTEMYKRFLSDVAELDRKLFNSMEIAYIQINELNWLRARLYDFFVPHEEEFYLGDFLEYSLNKRIEILVDLEKFYKLCTGTKLPELSRTFESRVENYI